MVLHDGGPICAPSWQVMQNKFTHLWARSHWGPMSSTKLFPHQMEPGNVA